MQIITTPYSYEDAINLLKNCVDILLLTNSNFGVRNNYNCTNDELVKIIDYINSNNIKTKIWINVNSFFFEDEILSLKNYLLFLNSLKNNIDKIVFNDFAVAQICYEENININLHYDPNTLVTSYGQFDFYLENNINSISVSNELFLAEILTILKNKPNNLKICLLAQGHVFIMHSRWNLISNFKNYVEDRDDEYVQNKVYYIKELNRRFSNIIYEDKHGSHMLTGYELCIIKQLYELWKNKLDYIKIDNIFQDENYALEIYKIYKNLINNFENNVIDENLINLSYQKVVDFSKSKKISSGFIGGIEEILNYEKK